MILEPGAEWPQRAFADIPYRDGVVVLGEFSGEPPDIFIARLNTQCALMAACGIIFRAAIVACNDDEPGMKAHRELLLLDIAKHVFAGLDCPVILVKDSVDRPHRAVVPSQ